jgi:hypothetical protein
MARQENGGVREPGADAQQGSEQQDEEFSTETLELLAREVDLNALPAGLLD